MPGGADRGSRSDGRQRRSWQRLLSADSFVGPGLSLNIGNGQLSVLPISPITSTSLGVGLLLAPTPALEDSSGLQLQVVTTGGIQRAAGGAELSINSMTAETASDDADTIAIYDSSASAHRKMTRADFLSPITAVPIGAVTMTLESTAPTGWFILDGSTIGNAASGATHADAGLQALFDIVKGVLPNLGTEVFANNDTVNLPDMRTRMPVGVSNVETAIDVLGETAGQWDHVHSVDPPSTISGVPSAAVDVHLQGIFDVTVPVAVGTELHTHSVNIAAFNSAVANPPALAIHFIVKF